MLEKSKVMRFEDLIAWKRSRLMVGQIYQISRSNAFAKDFSLGDQIRRSAVSVMANIAEGFERAGLGEFHRYLTIAKASCAEMRSHLYVANDIGYIDKETFAILLKEAEEIGNIIGGLRLAVQKKRDG